MPTYAVEQHANNEEVFAPEVALILYRSPKSELVCTHPITTDTRGRTHLGPASPLRSAEQHQLVRALGHSSLVCTADTTLALSLNTCLWWLPAGKRALHFDPKYKETASITRFNGRALPHPPLLFLAQPGTLTIFALGQSSRPTPQSRLYNAPFWNMFASHQVCRGTVAYPREAQPQQQQAWEDAFFNSYFTGPSRSDRYINWGRSHEEYLERLSGKHTYPKSMLVATKYTLDDLLRGAGALPQ